MAKNKSASFDILLFGRIKFSQHDKWQNADKYGSCVVDGMHNEPNLASKQKSKKRCEVAVKM